MLRNCLALLCGIWATGLISAEPPSAKEHTNSLGMKFIRIESGSFVMGEGTAAPTTREEWLKRDWDEAPAHPVRISKPFLLGIYEVTNSQYEKFDLEHKNARTLRGASKEDDAPVTYVTWQHAIDFCTWLSKKEGLPYRLPTEAEWEYACRAGTKTPFANGDKIAADEANLGFTADGKVVAEAVRVGSFKANPWGFYDMPGNVAEWCLDWYGPYESGEQVDPVGRSAGEARVCRGWSFLKTNYATNHKYARSSNRSGHLPEDANRTTGFRVVLGEMPATQPLEAVVQPYQKEVKTTEPPKGPDPTQPYFVSFTKEGKGPTIAKDSWGPVFNQWNHFSGVCVCPNGDVLATWYTTVGESGRECSQGISRLRVGTDRWEPVSSFLTIPDVNCHAPVLFRDGKRIYHFFTQSLNGWDDASDSMRYSDDNAATWSKPQIMLPRERPDSLSQPCCCIRTKDGALVLACDGGGGHKDERFLVSKDDGKTWKVGKGDLRAAVGKYAIHPTIFQRADGAILTYLRGPNPMPVAVSLDLGESFSVESTEFPGISVGQKAAVLKLNSGAVLLCSGDTSKKLVGGGTYAALSLDDGKTWPHIRKIEGAGGYMSLAQSPNGTIFLNGTQLNVVSFNEAWVKAEQK